jgi:hypothetical protein
MKLFFRVVVVSGLASSTISSVFAGGGGGPVGAPAPEIGDGVIGAIVAAIAMLALVVLPRFRKSRT